MIFKTDSVRVDGEFVYPNQAVFYGERVEIAFPKYEQRSAVPKGMLPVPKILYEDEAYLAVFKPSGVQTHPSRSAKKGKEDSMEERVMSSLGITAHSIHRLDAETQGILMFAKFPFAQVALQNVMQRGGFHKQYEAYVFGRLPSRSGIIEAPIERKHPDSFTRIVREDGKPAITSFCVQDIQIIDGRPVSHVFLSPITGRTHQLRVHMSYLHCPILGDPRYRTPPSTAFQEQHCIGGLILNAFRLSFMHPFLHTEICLSSSMLPDPFWYLKAVGDKSQPETVHRDEEYRG